MIVYSRALSVVRNALRPFLMINLAYFGLAGAGMAYGAWDRSAHDALIDSTRSGVAESLPGVTDAYLGGHFASAVAWTIGINLVAGTFAYITVPSFVIPFVGLLAGALRAGMWGVLFSPNLTEITRAGAITGALIALLIFLEGEGYVLGMLGAYIHGKSWLAPESVGATTRWEGYKQGAVRAIEIYPLIVAQLAIAAVYEATIAILILPLLK